MKFLPLFVSFLLSIASLDPVLAIDPGTAQGSLQVNGKAISISQAYAHIHDNAEGLLDFPTELRIVLADRQIPQDALAGIAFLPVEQMAREGKVQGLLLQLDPNDHSHVLVTVLHPPSSPGDSLATLTISTTGQKVLKRLDISGLRVMGEIERRDQARLDASDIPGFDCSLSFSAPLFHELAVTADLKGKAAQNSPQAAVLRKKARALSKGDFETVHRLSTEGANRRTEAFLAQAGPEGESHAKQMGEEMDRSIKNIRRVVVRGERAVVIFSDSEWVDFVREGAEWKSAN